MIQKRKIRGSVLTVIKDVYKRQETKNVKITAGVGVAGIAIIAILSKVKPALFDNGLSKIIDWFSVLDRLDVYKRQIIYHLKNDFKRKFISVTIVKEEN